MKTYSQPCHPSLGVIAGLDPAIHRDALQSSGGKGWMPGSSPGMTVEDGVAMSTMAG